jgi:predicted secreted acid phosphatase
MRRLATALGLLTALLLGAAATAEEPAAPASPEEIREYRESGEWRRDTRAAIGAAREFLVQRLDEGTDGRPAIVLDVDDTSLSNYRCLRRTDFEERGMCGSQRRNLPAIRQTRGLFHHARSEGVAVFFITGRRERARGNTIANLRARGYDGSWRLRMRPNRQPDSRRDGWKARTRRRIERRGYDIVVNVGDQPSDLDGGHAERTFKLPNPMYSIGAA